MTVTDFTILLSNTCNLRCRYCHFVETRPERHEALSIEYAEKAIRLFFEVPKKPETSPRVLCLNADGEAMHTRDLLFRSVALASRLKKDDPGVIIALVTNATLVDAEAASFFAQHGVQVTVSVDGDFEAHDSQRVNAHGVPSHKDAVHGIQLLQRMGVPVSLRAVVTPETSGMMLKSFQYLHQLGSSRRIKLRPLRQKGPPFYDSGWVEQFAGDFGQCVAELLRNGHCLNDLPDDAWHFAGLLADGRVRGDYCPAGTSMLWMTPDGQFYPCGLMTQGGSCGHINDIHTGSDMVGLLATIPSTRVREDSPLHREPCSSCRWLTACGGGCPAVAGIEAPPLCKVYRTLGEVIEEHLEK